MWQPLHKLISLHVPWGCTEALWSGALCLCSTVHTRKTCPHGRSWTACLTLGCLTCPLMRAGVWPLPPFYLLPPGHSILLLCLIYAALPSTSWLFCCSVLLWCSALWDSVPPPPQHPPVGSLSVSSATTFIPCHIQADYYQGMNMLRQSLTSDLLLC